MDNFIHNNQIDSEDKYVLEANVTANIRLVINIAKQFENNGFSLVELINKGKSGLSRAFKSFNQSKGFDFIDYATWHIRQAIVRAIVENQPQKPTPLNKIGLLMKPQHSVLKPDHFFLREPGIRDMESIKAFRRRVTRDTPMVNN